MSKGHAMIDNRLSIPHSKCQAGLWVSSARSAALGPSVPAKSARMATNTGVGAVAAKRQVFAAGATRACGREASIKLEKKLKTVVTLQPIG